jgi:hypothetical protein
MTEVKIRYNTLCTDNKLFWRILINGKENLCSDIEIKCPSFTTCDEVWDSTRNQNVIKHHITCTPSQIIWEQDKVILL